MGHALTIKQKWMIDNFDYTIELVVVVTIVTVVGGNELFIVFQVLCVRGKPQ